jgi:aryl sulfotransferase
VQLVAPALDNVTTPFERSWWGERHRSNILLVHYNDLKADLSGEIQRVADYLDIHVSPDIWPRLVDAAGFEAMRRDGGTLLGSIAAMLEGGGRTFFHMGMNERWRLPRGGPRLYEAKVEAMFSPACARWVAQGRLEAGDPRSMID